MIAGPSAVWWETHSGKFFWKRLGQGELGGHRKGNTGEMVGSYAVWPPHRWEASEWGILWTYLSFLWCSEYPHLTSGHYAGGVIGSLDSRLYFHGFDVCFLNYDVSISRNVHHLST